MKGNPATIVIGGKLITIDEQDLRPGDMVAIQVGDIVPADIRLTEAVGLEVDEFEITGELLPVSKEIDEDDALLFMGSKVTRGRGKGAVIRVGEHTEYGRVLKQERERDKRIEIDLFQKKYLGLIGLLLPVLLYHLLRGGWNFILFALFILISLLFILLQNDPLFYSLVVMREIKKLSRLNIQVRDPRQLEYLNQMDTVFFRQNRRFDYPQNQGGKFLFY